MGHVDTGTTKLLDCICGTNVQEGEAGGITQQIRATYFPAQNIRQRTKELKADAKLNVPGLLVIDYPGHESFTNLRSRGSGYKEQGLNAELYYRNKKMGETYSIVPASAIRHSDLLLLLVQWTQKTMIEKLMYSNEVQGTCLHHKEIKAAQDIKIPAQGLDQAIAGTALYVVGPYDDSEDIEEAAMEDIKSVLRRIDKSGEGVGVQASTLGSFEALREFLKSPAMKMPVSGISIGLVHKKDVMKASVLLEKKRNMAFDVKLTLETQELADEAGIKIFIADIIYHLLDQFKAYIDNFKYKKKNEASKEAFFPCVLKIMLNCVFNESGPIVLGVDVLKGVAKVGTPICIPQREFIDIGRIASSGNNHKPVHYAKKGMKVAIKMSSSAISFGGRLICLKLIIGTSNITGKGDQFQFFLFHFGKETEGYNSSLIMGLEQAIASTALYVVGPDYDSEDIKDAAMEDIRSVSTLGSFEALLESLKSPALKIHVSGISIGPIHKKDVMKASKKIY
ncbi:hypothetical protein ACSBR1_030349 [Camellia fascicularis]